jgi:hypothetical protein
VLQELWWQLLPTKNPRRYSKPKRRLKMIRRVLFPNIAGASVMESMNQIVQFDGTDFPTLPSVELRPKVEQGLPQFPIVRNARPLTNQTLIRLGVSCIREVVSCLPNVIAMSRGALDPPAPSAPSRVRPCLHAVCACSFTSLSYG